MKKRKIEVFNFSSMRGTPQVVNYKDKLILGDNVGKKLDLDSITRSFNLLYPTKTQCTITLLCLKGSMKVRINFTDYDVTAFNEVIIIPNTLSQVLSMSEDVELVVLMFSDASFFSFTPVSDLANMYNHTQNCPVLSIPPDKCAFLFEIYTLLRNDITYADFTQKDEVLQGYLQVYVAHHRHLFSSYAKSDEHVVTDRRTQIYLQFISLVNEHYSQHRDVKFYAIEMNISPKYLSQVVYSVIGKYSLDIIKERVIFEAKALLKSRKYTVQEVAYMLNFANPSFFGRYFLAETRCTPRQYMKKDMV